MALSQIGRLTNFAETLASAVGAGMLLGGFVAGAVGLLIRLPRQNLESCVLSWSYYGGILGVALVVLDLTA
jgi:uncharacterized membrane protein YdcZ (DUF606 family)